MLRHLSGTSKNVHSLSHTSLNDSLALRETEYQQCKYVAERRKECKFSSSHILDEWVYHCFGINSWDFKGKKEAVIFFFEGGGCESLFSSTVRVLTLALASVNNCPISITEKRHQRKD